MESGQAQVKALLSIINKATQDALSAYADSKEDVPSLMSTDERSVLSMANNLALKRAVRVLEGACEQLCATLAPPGQSIVDVNFSFSAVPTSSDTLYTALPELDLGLSPCGDSRRSRRQAA